MESSEEKYLIQRAKAATDPNEQKSIILTAKTLYPQNFKIQFMAYVFGKFFLYYLPSRLLIATLHLFQKNRQKIMTKLPNL